MTDLGCIIRDELLIMTNKGISEKRDMTNLGSLITYLVWCIMTNLGYK